MENNAFRKLTGSVDGDRLDSLFYLLIRDHLPTGVVEKIVTDIEKIDRASFTNGYLAEYSKLLSKRIRNDI